MRRKSAVWIFWGILIVNLAVRVWPIMQNNFYFTVDQGRDAVNIREIVQRHQILTRGPETTIRGIYTGPGWYYFQAIGYALTGGDPRGGVLMMALLNVILLGVVMVWAGGLAGRKWGLLTGIYLSVLWPYYDTSAYSFNPFPLVVIGVGIVMILSGKTGRSRLHQGFGGQVRKIGEVGGLLFLAANANLAGAAAMGVGVGIIAMVRVSVRVREDRISFGESGIIRKIGGWKKSGILMVLGVAVAVGVLGLANGRTLPGTIWNSIGSNSPQPTLTIRDGSGLGILSGTNYRVVTGEFINLVGETVVPQAPAIGIIVIIVITVITVINRSRVEKLGVREELGKSGRSGKSGEIKRILVIIGVMWAAAWLFFGATRGYRSWQSVYLVPLAGVGMMVGLSVWDLRVGKIGKIEEIRGMTKANNFSTHSTVIWFARRIIPMGLTIMVLLQWQNFWSHWANYPGRSDDPGILANQLKVIDWIYQKAAGQGFGVYTYTQGYFDYPQQYLFWWYGEKKYGYLPCEYSNLPGALKIDYVPGAMNYLTPKKDCSDKRFLIIESETNGEKNGGWLEIYRGVTEVREVGEVGGVRGEERVLTENSNLLFDQNVNLRNYWKNELHLKLPEGWDVVDRNGVITSGNKEGTFIIRAEKMPESSGELGISGMIGKIGGVNLSLSGTNKCTQGIGVVERYEGENGEVAVDAVVFRVNQKSSGESGKSGGSGESEYVVWVERSGSLKGAIKLTDRIIAGAEIGGEVGNVIVNCKK